MSAERTRRDEVWQTPRDSRHGDANVDGYVHTFQLVVVGKKGMLGHSRLKAPCFVGRAHQRRRAVQRRHVVRRATVVGELRLGAIIFAMPAA